MDDEQAFLNAIENFGREILENNPELNDVLQRHRDGMLETKDAIKAVWRIAAKTPEQGGALEQAMFDAFGVKPQSTDLAHFPDREKLLTRWGFDDEDLVFEPFEDRPGYKMLHPLLMGMIVELLQYDGDVPELRTGKLPEGGSPAVPIRTMARNPVAVGAMLRTASQEVSLELAEAQETHNQKMARMIEAVGGSDDAVTGLVRQETERGIAVPGYAPGTMAQVREVTAPTGTELALMPFEERQELAHKALTSTQGRRSAVPVIGQMILKELHNLGFTGTRLGGAEEGREIVTDVEWTMGIDGGSTERNPNFNFIDTAARALSGKIGGALSGNASRYRSLTLHVSPVNTVAERRVGWRAVLYGQGSSAGPLEGVPAS